MARAPRKALWLKMETNPEVEFEFFLAEKLGRTVGELRRVLSQDEYLHWAVYYSRKAQRRELQAIHARR